MEYISRINTVDGKMHNIRDDEARNSITEINSDITGITDNIADMSSDITGITSGMETLQEKYNNLLARLESLESAMDEFINGETLFLTVPAGVTQE